MSKFTDDNDANTRTGHQDNLHHLSPSLEVLTKHESPSISGEADTNTLDDAKTDDELVELGGEGGEETGEGSDEAT